jgi:hypothetical protein
MRGRKPMPTVLRIVTGNAGKRPLNTSEPKPVTAIPTCPAHLSPTAKRSGRGWPVTCVISALPLRPTKSAGSSGQLGVL